MTDLNTLELPEFDTLIDDDVIDIVQNVATTPEDRQTTLGDVKDYIYTDTTAATAAVDNASTTVVGKVELAIASELDTGTSDALAVTPDSLAGSNYGERIVVFCLNGTTALTTSEMAQFRVPSSMTGMNLVEVAMHCGKDGSSGAPVTNPITVSIQNGTTNMLSTNVTIDATEYDTSTAATPAVIDTAHDDIATGNVINVEVVSTGTAATYVEVVCVFRLP